MITFGEANDTFPFWSTDGDRVGYSRGNSIQIKRADGSGQEQKLAEGEGLYASFSSGGKHLVYFLESEATGSDLWYLHLEGDTTPQLFVRTPHDEDSCALSPDGNYLAYESNESGRDEIYLKRFPTAEGTWMLSVSGGADPFWSKDGKALYDWQGRDLMVVEVDTTGSKPQRSNPQRLFSANDDVLVDGLRNTDVSRDGRFLMIQNVRSQTVDGETVQPVIVVIQNWFAEFKGRK